MMKNLSRNEWLNVRKSYIGASDAPIIMNGSHFGKTPYLLWREKLGISLNIHDNEAMKYGRKLEPYALEDFSKKMRISFIPKMVFHKENTFMMATLDGISEDEKIAVEIKCPGEKDHQIAKAGKVPDKYYAQLQHQLACLSINQIHYFSFRQDEGIIIEVEKDEKYIEGLYQKEKEFWSKVLNFEAPDLNEEDFKSMENSKEWEEAAKKFIEAKKLQKFYEREKKKYLNELVEISNKQPSQGKGVQLMQITKKGNICYNKIPELKNMNLEIYRSSPIKYWVANSY